VMFTSCFYDNGKYYRHQVLYWIGLFRSKLWKFLLFVKCCNMFVLLHSMLKMSKFVESTSRFGSIILAWLDVLVKSKFTYVEHRSWTVI
jgi:hypothetical protein